MSRVDLTVFRPALPQLTHEWAVVPEDEPGGWEFEQAIRNLPTSHEPWTPVPVEIVNPREGREALRAKLPWWASSTNVLVLRDEAIETVGAILAPHGRLLPLDGRNARLAIFAAPLVEDALIEEESDIHQSEGSVYARLDFGVFNADAVGRLQAFVTPIGRGHSLFMTEDLVREVEATGDTAGLVFEPVGILTQNR